MIHIDEFRKGDLRIGVVKSAGPLQTRQAALIKGTGLGRAAIVAGTGAYRRSNVGKRWSRCHLETRAA